MYPSKIFDRLWFSRKKELGRVFMYKIGNEKEEWAAAARGARETLPASIYVHTNFLSAPRLLQVSSLLFLFVFLCARRPWWWHFLPFFVDPLAPLSFSLRRAHILAWHEHIYRRRRAATRLLREMRRLSAER